MANWKGPAYISNYPNIQAVVVLHLLDVLWPLRPPPWRGARLRNQQQATMQRYHKRQEIAA